MDTPPKFDPSGFSTNPGAERTKMPWGYEILLTPPGAPYAAKLIHVEPGKRLSLQIHDTKIQTQTLIDGKGFLVLEDSDGTLRDVPLEPGVGYHIAVGQRHRLCAVPDQDVTVFEVSSPEEGTTWRLADDYRRPMDEEMEERWDAAKTTSREAAIDVAEAELDEIIERLERELQRQEPELFDSEGRLLEGELTKKLLERMGGKKTLTYDDIVRPGMRQRVSHDGAHAADAT